MSEAQDLAAADEAAWEALGQTIPEEGLPSLGDDDLPRREEAQNAGEASGRGDADTQSEGEGGDTEGVQAETADAEAAKPDESGEGAGEAADTGEETAPLTPPVLWDASMQEVFAGMTREQQQAVLDYTKAADAAHTQRSQEVAPFRNAIEPWKPFLSQLGVAPEAAFNDLMATVRTLHSGTPQQKQQVVTNIIQQYGVDMGGETAEGETAPDPRVMQLEQQISEMRQQWNTNHAAQTQQAVDQFANAKTETGELRHPFFADVRERMAQLAAIDETAGRQPDLEQLYEAAIWSDPSVREKMLANQRIVANGNGNGAAIAKAEEERAERAQRASATVRGGGSTSVAVTPKTPDEVYDQAFNGVNF